MAEETDFLPAERACALEIEERFKAIVAWAPVKLAMDSIDQPLFLLNLQRQILYANPAFLGLCTSAVLEANLGKRFGEALGCTNVAVSRQGCGTGLGCRRCSTAQAIQSALDWNAADGTARILRWANLEEWLRLDLHFHMIRVAGEPVLFCRAGHHRGMAGDLLGNPPVEMAELCELLCSGGPYPVFEILAPECDGCQSPAP